MQGIWVPSEAEGYFSFDICRGKEKVRLTRAFTWSIHSYIICPFLLVQPLHSPNLSTTLNDLHPSSCSPVPLPTYSPIPLPSQQAFTCIICLKNSINTSCIICCCKFTHSKIKIIRHNVEADSLCGHPQFLSFLHLFPKLYWNSH